MEEKIKSGAKLSVTLALVLTLMVVTGLGQSADGPYFVVDQGAIATGHVFPTIPAALTALNGLGNQAWGATLMLLPGEYNLATTQNITIPYLKIVTRHGEDRARITGNTAAPIFGITARGVTIEDVKILPTGTATGIRVAAPDVTLRNVSIVGSNGDGIAALDANRLAISGCSITNSTDNGVNLTNSPNVLIEGCKISRSGDNGVLITTSNTVTITTSDISNNTASAISVTGSNYVDILDNKAINANAAPAINIASSGYCDIVGNSLVGNQGGVALTGCVGCTIESTTCTDNNGPAVSITDGTGNTVTNNKLYGTQTAAPATATILLAGAATQNTVSKNELSYNQYGIVLNEITPNSPSGNVISENSISATTIGGIFLRRSGGNNSFVANTISDSVKDGIWIQQANGDRFIDNEVSRSAANGVNIDAVATANVDNCLLQGNRITESGQNGILATAPAGNLINSLTLSANTITGSTGHGIFMEDLGAISLNGPIVSFNKITANEADGLRINGSANLSIRHNTIAKNENIGLNIVALRGPASVRQNTIYANERGGVAYAAGPGLLVLEENSLFDNLGYALSSFEPLPAGTSFAKNYWGSSTGPAGVLNGTGNAAIGLPGPNIIQPILPAPAFMGTSPEAKPIINTADAQLSLINSFAAGRVVVDRTDTSGVKIVFTGVSVGNNALVSTAPFTEDALDSPLFAELEKVLAASCVVVSGIHEGTATISFEHQQELEGEDVHLALYVYEGGHWMLADSGEWTLADGEWKAIPNCHFADTYQVVGDIPVKNLTGEVKAIALLQETPQAE